MNQLASIFLCVVLPFELCLAQPAPVTARLTAARQSFEIGQDIPLTVSFAADPGARVSIKTGVFDRLRDHITVIDPSGAELHSLSESSHREAGGWLEVAADKPLSRTVDLLELYPSPRDVDYPHTLDQAGEYRIRFQARVTARHGVAPDQQWEGMVAAEEIVIRLLPVSAETLARCGQVLQDNTAPPARRLAALRSVAAARSPVAMDLLRLSIRDPHVAVRFNTVRALGRVKTPAAFGLLEAALDDTDPVVRAQAVVAVGQFATPRARELLLRELRSKRERSYRAAIVVLGDMGDAGSLDALAEAAERDETAWVRERATESANKIKARAKPPK